MEHAVTHGSWRMTAAEHFFQLYIDNSPAHTSGINDMKKWILIAVFGAACTSGCAVKDRTTFPGSPMTYSRKAYEGGRADAQRDIQRGVLATESAGLPTVWAGEYDRLLKQRYGVEDRGVAGCMVDDRIVGHMAGYNEVSNAEIKRRFGADVFDRTAKDAQALYKKKHPNGPY